MEITEETTRKVASLAKMRLTDGEVQLFTKELTKILTYVEKLNELDTTGVEGKIHGIPLKDHFREDKAVEISEEQSERIVKSSEHHVYNQYKVPPILGEET